MYFIMINHLSVEFNPIPSLQFTIYMLEHTIGGFWLKLLNRMFSLLEFGILDHVTQFTSFGSSLLSLTVLIIMEGSKAVPMK